MIMRLASAAGIEDQGDQGTAATGGPDLQFGADGPRPRSDVADAVPVP